MEILGIFLTGVIFIYWIFLTVKIARSLAIDGFFETWKKIKDFNKKSISQKLYICKDCKCHISWKGENGRCGSCSSIHKKTKL